MSEAANNSSGPRILVTGDAMLDRYLHGRETRLCPEGPGAVFKVERIEERLGGAAAVAYLCAGLGCRVFLRCPLGCDEASERLKSLCSESEIDVGGGGSVEKVTVKERRVQDGRILPGRTDYDHDFTTPPPPLSTCRFNADAILVADYRRGAVGGGFVSQLRERYPDVPIIVDPGRDTDWNMYRGATIIKANFAEWFDGGDADLDWADLVVTQGECGILWHNAGEKAFNEISGHRVPALDPTGCGDTVLAVLGWSLARGKSLDEACRLANRAGAIQVQRLGVQQISQEELLDQPGGGKIISADHAARIAAAARSSGKRVVFTNGCFDVLHHGHCSMLQASRTHGDLLIVGLNSDSSVRRLKGAGRPVNPAEQRAAVLSALTAVDYVVVFDDDTPLKLIEAIRPDVLCKGAEYRGCEVVKREAAGRVGRVELIPMVGKAREVSTTAVIDKMRAGT